MAMLAWKGFTAAKKVTSSGAQPDDTLYQETNAYATKLAWLRDL